MSWYNTSKPFFGAKTMEKKQVFKTSIDLGNGIVLDAYTAHEKDVNGNYINYLSGRGLAESIDLPANSTVLNRLSEKLKAKLGANFLIVQGILNNDPNNPNLNTTVNLWTTEAATKYYLYHMSKGNEKAELILDVLASTTLDIIINDKFDRGYKVGDAERLVWERVRSQSKITRKQYEKAIHHYIKKHKNELDKKYLDYIFANCTNAQYLHIFNSRCKELRLEWNIEDQELFRDSLTEEELLWLQQIEGVTARWIINDDMEPLTATKKAIKELQIPISKRKL